MRKAIGVLTLIACLLASTVADAQNPHVNYTNITGQTTTTPKPASGFLHTVCLNTPTATSVITMFDNTAASGTKIGTITVVASPQPYCFIYNVSFNVGLTIVTATASSDITVSWE